MLRKGAQQRLLKAARVHQACPCCRLRQRARCSLRAQRCFPCKPRTCRACMSITSYEYASLVNTRLFGEGRRLAKQGTGCSV